MKKLLFFLCMLWMGVNLSAQNKLTGYEYWFDNDYQQRVVQNVMPASNYTLATSLDVNALPEGIHAFHIRSKDNSGNWSTTVSQYFQKLAPIVPKKLVAYEYWVNDEYDKKYSRDINKEQSFIILDEINVNQASKATNAIHFRFKDDAGQWSTVLTSDFYRPVEPEFTHIVGLSEVTFTNTSKYADKYEWDFGNGNTSEQVNPEHTYAEPGVYQVKLIAHNKEFTDSVFHYVEVGYTAITSPKQENRILEVSPNPVDNIATITMNVDKAAKVKLVLYNLSGQAVLNVYEQYTLPGKKEILLDTSRLASGAYMLEMTVENNRIVRKITVK